MLKIKSAPATGWRMPSMGVKAPWRSTGRVDQHLAVPRGSVQQVLVSAFDPQFTDQRSARICRGIDVLEVLLADCRDIAQCMHRYRAERIMARQPGADIHPREFVAMHRETRHFFVVELQLDRYAFVDMMRQDGAFDAVGVLGIEQTYGHQVRQGGVDFRYTADLFANQFQLKCRQILRQNHAVSIEDQAAAGRDRIGAHAITL